MQKAQACNIPFNNHICIEQNSNSESKSKPVYLESNTISKNLIVSEKQKAPIGRPLAEGQ